MSDSNKLRARNLVVGTAGHIDHGKTSLVQALTGVDTDRLAEEKRRGISIDLGFAHVDFPGDVSLGFVDVPGHENFVKNMLAGVSGIAAALLIVAADEGIKPQTREHFDICRLLNVRTGLVVLTKSDLVSPGRIEAVRADVMALCAGSFMEGMPILPVSAKTGAGLDDLRIALQRLATDRASRDSEGLVRLPIDRSFALKGFGTVVTGTLAQGTLKVGDAVALHPSGRQARIRGLQMSGKPIASAHAGERTAVNLSGIDHAEIARGDVLTHVNQLDVTSTVDVAVDWLERGNLLRRRQQFLLHSGTAEIPVSLKLLHRGSAFARLWLSQPALLLPEDRFVLRRPSPAATVAGGVVLDAFPPSRLNRARTERRLQSLENEPWDRKLDLMVEESSGGRKLGDLVRRTGLSSDQLRKYIDESSRLSFAEDAGLVFSIAWLDAQRAKIVAWLSDFHHRHPGLPGAPLAQARTNLEPSAARAVFDNFPAIRLDGDTVALAAHKPRVSDEQNRLLSEIEHKFRQGGYQPPAPSEVLRTVAIEPGKARSSLEALIKANRLVRISGELVFHADVMRHIQQSLAVHRGRRFSVPEFKEWTRISRKYAIPLLEYLDRQRVTKRDGDARIVL